MTMLNHPPIRHVLARPRVFFMSSIAILLLGVLGSTLVQADAPQIISGGFRYMCALTQTNGTVKCWGAGPESGFGSGGTGSALPKDTINLTNVFALASGYQHNCALRSDGAVWCWGRNNDSALADSSISNVLTPQVFAGFGGPMIGLHTGPASNHTCAISPSFGAKCWGKNTSGQLGNGTFVSTPVPQDVNGVELIQKIATGSNSTCAITLGGALKCWGYNGNGELGDGTGRDSRSPVQVIGLAAGVVDVAMGRAHACALLATGAVKCWGEGQEGQLGRGGVTTRDNPDSNSPVDVIGIKPGAKQLVAGAEYNCVLISDGAVQCWGYRNAAVGDGVASSPTNNVQPTASVVTGLSGPAIAIAGGHSYACAVVVSGAIECWGNHPTSSLSYAEESRGTSHLEGFKIDPRLTMTEYRNAALDYYFITSRYQEKLLFKAVAPDFQPTGLSFKVSPSVLLAGTQPITRFYFDKVAKGASRGSHFYTLVDAERAALNGLNPANANTPKLPQNEGTDSFAFAPAVEGVGGSCAAGQTPLYRAFRGNARFADDPNHRFTTDLALYNSLVTQGWDGEGVKICVTQ
jgi:alpha-tubulin suppressor-like RCC1 family protein